MQKEIKEKRNNMSEQDFMENMPTPFGYV